jgi:O-acetyl-ADP-ribose deacetylase (regulator of RNase III)
MPIGLKNRIILVRGDITRCEVDAIVNAANPSLLGGGGVDGAIHGAAGPELLQECRTLGGCPPGEAKITRGYRLPASWVIHTPGPVWHGGNQGEPEILASCYRNALHLAASCECKTLAFPAISCGVYGYPPEKACAVALETLKEFLKEQELPEKIYLVSFGEEIYRIYATMLQSFFD